ncbi:MAG: glycosyltransferase family 2 protein [Ignavibacteriae bacterium]|nr:glycosyltransferase family 2 protein [Ignavibacteriota bacterium]
MAEQNPEEKGGDSLEQEPRSGEPRTVTEAPPIAASLPSQPPPAPTVVPPQQRTRDRRFRQQQRQRQRGRPEGQHFREGGKEISVVVPLYNEEQSLRELYDKLRNVLNRTGRYEIIFVDDGSTDSSSRILHELRHRDRRVKIIRFRRNYGKSAALSVGFAHAEGHYIVTMDADLQDDPNEIPSLINEVKKGFDLISGWKRKRRDPITKTIPSRFFNFVTSVMTGIHLHDFNCGLKAYRKDVAKEVKIYGELHRYIPVLAHWLGYKVGELPVQHHPRRYGKTKYGVGRFWKGFLDLLTVLFTTRYLQRPLHLFGFWGMVFIVAGFVIDLYLVILKFTQGIALGNRPLFLAGVLLIIVGVQFVSIGLLGEIISKTRQTAEKEYSIREILK